MSPSTGTFTTMDTYQRSIFDPVSLHKYLYANANPVMNSDPSGYFTLSDYGAAEAGKVPIEEAETMSAKLAHAVFKSVISGFGFSLLDAYRQWRTTGTVDISHVIDTFFLATGTSLFFGVTYILGYALQSTIILTALGGSSAIFAGAGLAQSVADGIAGKFDLAVIDILFAAGAVKGAKECYDRTLEVATAKNTAKTSTDISVENSFTASNLKNGTLSNYEARKWYLEQERKIPDMIDRNKPLIDQAKQAFNLRNQFRTQARELMADRKAAAELYKNDPNMTWEEIVQKYRDRGLEGNEIYKAILESATHSRKSVNEALGLGDY